MASCKSSLELRSWAWVASARPESSRVRGPTSLPFSSTLPSQAKFRSSRPTSPFLCSLSTVALPTSLLSPDPCPLSYPSLRSRQLPCPRGSASSTGASSSGDSSAPAPGGEDLSETLQASGRQQKQQHLEGAGDEAKESGAKEGGKESLDEWYAREYGRPAERVWDVSRPQVYYFAVASAQSLMDDGALLEEVLSDAITRAQRGGRERDVWMVMEPAFLDHPKLAGLKAALRRPTAAVLSTNGPWMMSVVRELLPQATIGKFYAPTESLPNPFKSNLQTSGAVIGGGAVWH